MTTDYVKGRDPTPAELERINEYLAKAMLLDMYYDPRDHTFVPKDGDPRGAFRPDTMEAVLRADTLTFNMCPEWLKPIDYAWRYNFIVKQTEGGRDEQPDYHDRLQC